MLLLLSSSPTAFRVTYLSPERPEAFQASDNKPHTNLGFLGRLETVRCAVPLCFRWDAFGWLAAQCERKAIPSVILRRRTPCW